MIILLAAVQRARDWSRFFCIEQAKLKNIQSNQYCLMKKMLNATKSAFVAVKLTKTCKV
jgi:hypothetical protein